jgi:hypothetical protein
MRLILKYLWELKIVKNMNFIEQRLQVNVMEEIDFKLTMKLGNSKKYEFY